MSYGVIVFLFFLLAAVIIGIIFIVALWVREGSILPGDRSERIHREILSEIDRRLERFEKLLGEARKLESLLIGLAKESETPREKRPRPQVKSIEHANPPSPAEEKLPPVPELLPEEESKERSEPELPARTKRIKELAAKGCSVAEIAKELGMGKGEVELYLSLGGGHR